jgi:inner membrane transporter RhtA
LCSILSIQLGTALATGLFAVAGVIGVAFMRNAFSSLALAVATRLDLRGLRGLTATHWRWAAALGVTTMAMNLALYAAVARIPLGVAMAIDFLGPITVAVLGTRKAVHLVWPVLAYGGVLLLTPLTGVTSLDPFGIVLALAAACGWGAYIVMTARTSTLFGNATGLTLSTAFGALFALPLLLLSHPSGLLVPSVLLLGLVVALLSTAVPFSLEFAVLRRASPRTVGVLLSAEPAVATLIGLVVLGQQVGAVGWLAILLVSVAGAGVVLFPDTPNKGSEEAADAQDRRT